MINRRNFVRSIPALSMAGMISLSAEASDDPAVNRGKTGNVDRKYWVSLTNRIANPVLYHLSRGELKKQMPVEKRKGNNSDRRNFTHLEAVGRTLSGIAPWLSVTAVGEAEQKVQQQLLGYTLQGLSNAVNPASADYLNFTKGAQPLVDGAFLALGFLRAPEALWEPLDNTTKQRLIKELKGQRVIKPGDNNWVLFASINEAFLLSIGEQYDANRLHYGIKKYKEWYLGDGWYGDGPKFHFDYYNSYVMQPMLLQVLQVLVNNDLASKEEYALALKRMQRYGEEQERLISPEGTYPPVGRSIAYRIGAFQVLADLAWKEALPRGISPAQVRSALSAVMKQQFEAKGTFDDAGWLQIGFCGHQPDAANDYISTGSLYLCTNGFLPLGLPPDNPFWKMPPEDWTSKKAWSGKSFSPGHAIGD